MFRLEPNLFPSNVFRIKNEEPTTNQKVSFFLALDLKTNHRGLNSYTLTGKFNRTRKYDGQVKKVYYSVNYEDVWVPRHPSVKCTNMNLSRFQLPNGFHRGNDLIS